MAVSDPLLRPMRSVLYVPGSNSRAIEKAQGLPVDAIIFDLEDAVTAAEKPAARAVLVSALTGQSHPARLVRINSLETEWGYADAAAFASLPVDGILLPKVNGPEDLDALAAIAPSLPLWAMMETPLGVLRALEIASHPRLAGFVLGTNDLAKDLGSRAHPGRLPLQAALQMCLLAARARGLVCLDGVYNAFKDDAGLQAECEQGRDLGFDGKTLIHPAQVAIANAVFGPQPGEIELAQRQIAAFERAMAAGQGVAVVDGKIVENLHIVSARQTLAKAASIAKQMGAI